MFYPNTQLGTIQDIALNSSNVYLNNTFNSQLGEKWMVKSGLAFNYDHQNIDLDKNQIATNQKMVQAKLGFSHFLNEQTELKLGADWVNFSYEQKNQDGRQLPVAIHQQRAFGLC